MIDFADLGDNAVLREGVQPLACWDYGFEFRRRRGCLSLLSVLCSVGRGLCDELIIRSEESYKRERECMCVCVCV